MIEKNQILDDKYRMVRKLGAGGFGNVWLADDILIENRQVAIKSLKRKHIVQESPLIEEMQFLNTLDHPNIIKFFHHSTDDDNLYLVMEYCKGGSLDKLLRYGPQPIDRVFNWADTITQTMQLVHEKKIIHHDLKPENLLLTDDGKIKIGDFGVANQNIGTIYYLAPEQILHELQHDIDPRIDIYALGITCVELIHGNNPFYDLTRQEMLQKKVQHNFIPTDLERWAQEILLRATHPLPEQRFQTMQEFKEAIIAKSVPYHFDINTIKAQSITESAKSNIKKKKWKSAEKECNIALDLSPNCVPALITAGQIKLMLQKTDLANDFFTRAVTVNPRASVQKELGWILLQKGHFPKAISMLNDYLQRDATDYEAYNLLLECLYKNNRYRTGKECCEQIQIVTKKHDCFQNNGFLFEFFADKMSINDIYDISIKKDINEFLRYNTEILTETEKSYELQNIKMMKSKLLFQDFRFNKNYQATNRIKIKYANDNVEYFDSKIVSIGRNKGNIVKIDSNSISRRHAVIMNFKNDVWIYDLGSTQGTFVDDKRVEEKCYLNGVHKIKISDIEITLATSDDILI